MFYEIWLQKKGFYLRIHRLSGKYSFCRSLITNNKDMLESQNSLSYSPDQDLYKVKNEGQLVYTSKVSAMNSVVSLRVKCLDSLS